ncbi:MAG TPA: type I-E CRISPR-associated protein Cas7/Cse4/CasC [Dehalococcoidia bacterium]
MRRFLQLHYLTAYPASLLNRDDAGFAKRIPFGGAVRTRISSQCLKRHWRTFDGDAGLAGIRGQEIMSVRSRYTFREKIARPLVELYGEERVYRVTAAVANHVLGKGKEKEGVDAKTLQTKQIVVLGYPEVEYLRGVVERVCANQAEVKEPDEAVKRELKAEGLKNLRAIGNGAGLDAALFGRMKTSDLLADCDAAVHVAHAFTVHEEQSETDYFTAVDDLMEELEGEGEGRLGAGHVNAAELTSGLYYGYVAVDLPLLVSNLEACPPEEWERADRGLAAEVAARLVRIVAQASPGARRGATAPYAFAHFLAAEVGDAQPCSWANAFFRPVPAGPDLEDRALQALGRYLERFDAVYEPGNERRYITLNGAAVPGAADAGRLSNLAAWVRQQVEG